MSGTTVLTEKWPVLGRREQAATWLTIWTDLGRAPRTIDAYTRELAEYLLMCRELPDQAADPAHLPRARPAAARRRPARHSPAATKAFTLDSPQPSRPSSTG
ncbi:hypothetical protein [Kitasatospora sp. NPDC056531]|uniref:hypothetical protein n=1 Tax=Kitasatospora sp. NPDC056531 TaxID=3345856 RepID=UPI00368032C5